ncbi:hypothetical protein Tco_0018500 [Tanacetum coccineum]
MEDLRLLRDGTTDEYDKDPCGRDDGIKGAILPASRCLNLSLTVWGKLKIRYNHELVRRSRSYEALYGRKCRSPVCWSEVGDSQLTGLELIRDTTEKIIQIKNCLLTAHSRQKSYADMRAKPLEFEGHPYTLEFPEELKGIHNTFHVSNLKKCLAEGDVVVPIDEIQLDDKLHMIEEPMEVVDREVKRLKQSRIPIVKVY